jgi:TPR repeat protein
LSVPINDFAIANEALAKMYTEEYYPCCGKSVCAGCVHSFRVSGNGYNCPFCNSDRAGKTRDEKVEEVMKRVEANDAASIYMLACYYQHGLNGLQQDEERAMELFTRAADLGFSKAHNNMADVYRKGGDMKKAKFHLEAAAMAGHEAARCNFGVMEAHSGNMERAVKHWTIGASAGDFMAMHNLLVALEKGYVSRESIDSTLTAYNNSCAETRSKARDAAIQFEIDNPDYE